MDLRLLFFYHALVLSNKPQSITKGGNLYQGVLTHNLCKALSWLKLFAQYFY